MARAADAGEPGDRDRPAPGDRSPLAVGLVRRVVARRHPGGGGDPREHRAGAAAPRAQEGTHVRVLIAGGGTAGHVYPALAVARRLREDHGAEVRFAGTSSGVEAELVPAAGFPFVQIEAMPLARRLSPGLLRFPFVMLRSVRRCRALVEGVDVAVGMGGYASAPARV